MATKPKFNLAAYRVIQVNAELACVLTQQKGLFSLGGAGQCLDARIAELKQSLKYWRRQVAVAA